MAKARKLARSITLAGVTYDAGHEVDDELAKQIHNPKAYIPLAEADAAEDESGRDAGTESGHRLASTVTIGGTSYGPGDFVPDEVARQIRNPKAWEGGKLPDLDVSAAKAAADDEPKGPSEDGGAAADAEASASDEGTAADAEASASDEVADAGSKTARSSRSRAR